jgi:hypothetical protein
MFSETPKNIKEEYRREFEEICRTPSCSERYDDDLTSLDDQDDLFSSNPDDTSIDESLFNTVIGDGTLFNQPGEIDTSLDDILNGDTSTYQAGTIPQNYSEPVLFSLHGEQVEGNLTRPFTPELENISLHPVDGNGRTEYSIRKLDYICLNSPESISADTVTAPEIVKTFCGRSEKVNVPVGQESSNGIFCLDHAIDSRFKYLFIPADNIRTRCYTKPIGEILLDHRMINKMTLIKALEQQKKMRKIKFGQILEKKARLKPGTVERVLRQAAGKQLTGQLLVKAGLISEKQVEETLKLQKGLRNKKVGDILVKQGEISEDDFYTVLAEKFRKSFVNLYDVFFCKETGKIIPCELIKKLKILPLSIVNGRLLLVTSHPEISQVSDILHQTLECPFELFVSTASQLKSAILEKCRK